jgi:hypothetical protein
VKTFEMVLLNHFSQFITEIETVSTVGIVGYDIINSGRVGQQASQKLSQSTTRMHDVRTQNTEM